MGRSRAVLVAVFRRYTPVDAVIVSISLLLCALAIAFSNSGGFVADGAAATRGSLGVAESDLCVLSAVLLFGVLLATIGWWPGRGLLALVKAISFSAVWMLQLAALGWIDLGSYRLTLLDSGNLALAAWLVVFLLALPAVNGTLLLSLNRLTSQG